jgi:acyl-CoA thioester hydrolase
VRKRDEFTFSHMLRVRWAEVDRQDVVFNGNYLLYFDVALTEYWRTIGFRYPQDLQKDGTDVFAVKATTEFHGSATYDDVLEVCCRVSRLGRSSMQFTFAIFRSGEHLTSGELVYVNAAPATRQAAPWPIQLRNAILGYEKTPPELSPPPPSA